jgi:hypothetical protein
MSESDKTSRELATMKGTLFASAGVSLLLTEALPQEKFDGPLALYPPA